ncbi:hypothetical protein CH275_26810 [Rhodococcus sp. 06-235-1A]|nr:hypothetical protein CH275_26810 [Rhodococcus sp. 06-235-1A]
MQSDGDRAASLTGCLYLVHRLTSRGIALGFEGERQNVNLPGSGGPPTFVERDEMRVLIAFQQL